MIAWATAAAWPAAEVQCSTRTWRLSEGRGLEVDQRDLDSEVTRGGRPLGSHEPCPDDRQAAAGRERLAQVLRVCRGAQRVHSGWAGERQRASAGACGD